MRKINILTCGEKQPQQGLWDELQQPYGNFVVPFVSQYEEEVIHSKFPVEFSDNFCGKFLLKEVLNIFSYRCAFMPALTLTPVASGKCHLLIKTLNFSGAGLLPL